MSSKQKRLAMARKRRHQIAAQLIALERGHIALERILTDPPPCLERVSLYQVMKRAPGLGPQGIKKTLTNAHVWPETLMGSFTRQDAELVIHFLPPRARKYEKAAG